MKVTNHIYPTGDAQRAAILEKGPDGPIYMVNLLKFKPRAQYKDGRATKLTGREAYALYGAEVSKLITQYGGKIIFAGDVTHLTIGEVEDLWDEVAIAQYPNRKALLEMSTSDAFRKFSHHREAGLAGQLNIETVATNISG